MVELDNSQLVSRLENLRTAVVEAEIPHRTERRILLRDGEVESVS